MEDCHICMEQRGQVSVPGGAIYEDDLVYANLSGLCHGRDEAARAQL
jgi:hypothetical protein